MKIENIARMLKNSDMDERWQEMVLDLCREITELKAKNKQLEVENEELEKEIAALERVGTRISRD